MFILFHIPKWNGLSVMLIIKFHIPNYNGPSTAFMFRFIFLTQKFIHYVYFQFHYPTRNGYDHKTFTVTSKF